MIRLVVLHVWLGEGQTLGCWLSRTSRLFCFVLAGQRKNHHLISFRRCVACSYKVQQAKPAFQAITSSRTRMICGRDARGITSVVVTQ